MKISCFLPKMLLNIVTIIAILSIVAIFMVFWFPAYISFGSKVYGVNIPKTPLNVIILLFVFLGTMAGTYKFTRNNWHFFLIVLSMAILLSHFAMVLFTII